MYPPIPTYACLPASEKPAKQKEELSRVSSRHGAEAP